MGVLACWGAPRGVHSDVRGEMARLEVATGGSRPETRRCRRASPSVEAVGGGSMPPRGAMAAAYSDLVPGAVLGRRVFGPCPWGRSRLPHIGTLSRLSFGTRSLYAAEGDPLVEYGPVVGVHGVISASNLPDSRDFVVGSAWTESEYAAAAGAAWDRVRIRGSGGGRLGQGPNTRQRRGPPGPESEYAAAAAEGGDAESIGSAAPTTTPGQSQGSGQERDSARSVTPPRPTTRSPARVASRPLARGLLWTGPNAVCPGLAGDSGGPHGRKAHATGRRRRRLRRRRDDRARLPL